MTPAEEKAIAALEAQIAEMERFVKRVDAQMKIVTVGAVLVLVILAVLSARAGDWRGAIAVTVFGLATASYYRQATRLIESNDQLRDQLNFWAKGRLSGGQAE